MKKILAIAILLLMVSYPLWAADTKITDLTAGTPVLGDVTVFVDDPAGTPITKKMTLQALADIVLADLEAGDIPDISATYQPLDAMLTSIAALTDPNNDRIAFWDDSAGAITWLTVGTGLSITDVTLSAAGTTTLAGMTDTDITGPAANDVLAWNGTDWVDLAVAGDVTGAVSGSDFVVTIANDAVEESMLKAVDAASDEDVFTYESTTGDFEWHSMNELLDAIGSAAQGDILFRGAAGWGFLAAGTSGYFLKTQGAAADVVWAAPPGGGDITAVGDCANGDCFTDGGTGSQLIFEGTDNAYETVLVATDATADVIITLPVITGTVVLGPSAFGTDNRLTKTDGTGNLTQITGISVDDSNNVSGMGTLSAGDVTTSGSFIIGAVGINGTELGVLNTYAGINPAANVQSILGAADYAAIALLQEASLEAVMDLEDMQGAVTDGQVPNTITIDLATLATTFTASANNSTDETVYPVFVDGATGAQGAETDTGFTYNPSTGVITATKISVTNIDYSGDLTYTGGGNSVIKLNANAGGVSPTAASYEIYFDAGILKWNENGAEKTAAKLEDTQTFTGAKTFNALYLENGATSAGFARFYEDTDDGAHYAAIQAQAMAASYTLTLPVDDGTNGQALLTNGSGVLSWGSPAASAGGSDTQVQFNSGGSTLAGDAGFIFTAASDTLTLGEDGQDGGLVFYNELGATDYNHTIQPNGSQTGAITTTLPATTGTLLNQALTNTYIFVGSAGGVATGVAMSGDATIANTGAVTIANDAITMAKLDEDGNFTDWVGNWTFNTGTFTLGNGAIIADGQTLTFDESAADPNDADVTMAAADGVLTIAAANGANNENLTLDFDATANQVAIGTGTGVDTISTGALNLITTGTVRSKIHVATDADGKTLDKTTECNGSMQMATGAGTWVLPDIDDSDGTGWAVCVYSTGANAVVVDPDAEDTITYDGTTDTAGDSITSASAAGDFVCLVVTSVSSNVANWTVLGRSGTWTQN